MQEGDFRIYLHALSQPSLTSHISHSQNRILSQFSPSAYSKFYASQPQPSIQILEHSGAGVRLRLFVVIRSYLLKSRSVSRFWNFIHIKPYVSSSVIKLKYRS